jgi:hypothetical protein
MLAGFGILLIPGFWLVDRVRRPFEAQGLQERLSHRKDHA